MSYRRNYIEGGTYFLTLCLANRSTSLLTDYIEELRTAYKQTQEKQPFTVEAMVILPEHLHMIWTLPENDFDYPNRVRLFKGYFSRQLPKYLSQVGNASLEKKGELGIWQRRYWEHTIRDQLDFNQHMDYVHYNPAKHGLVVNIADWPYSTFHREVKRGRYTSDWGNNENNLDEGINFGE